MRALFYDKELKFLDLYPLKPRKKGEASVKILLAGICRTDIEILGGYKSFKGVIGHEFVGIVHDATNQALIGKRVVGEINIGCGECTFCLKGMKRHCARRKTIGIHEWDGCFADFINIPEENLHILPDDLGNDRAVFVEPLSAAMNIVTELWLKPTDQALVIGDGKLGILVAQVLKMVGVDVKVMGKHRKKLSVLDWMGIDNYVFSKIDQGQVIVKKKNDLEEAMGKSGFDVVVECSGSPSGLEIAKRVLNPRGYLVLKSTLKDEVCLDLSHLVVNELRIVGSRCGPYEPSIRALRKGLIEVRHLITARFPFEDWHKAIETAKKPESLKVILEINES